MHWLKNILDRVAALESRAASAEGERRVTAELARVTAYAGGVTCTVTYPNYPAGETPSSGTLTGTTRILGFQLGYTPAVGHNVLVVNSPQWSGVACAISAF